MTLNKRTKNHNINSPSILQKLALNTELPSKNMLARFDFLSGCLYGGRKILEGETIFWSGWLPEIQ